MENKKILPILGFIGLYLISTGVSWAAFNYFGGGESTTIEVSSPLPSGDGEEKLVDTSGPKTEVCPLNGEKFTKAEQERWLQRRPLTVMIENHQESRPQSGLSSADVVYEAVAEGGVTRFLSVFYCRAVSNEVVTGPVRSARTYFLDWASEYSSNPLYAHVGGAHCDPETKQGCLNGAKADALGQIREYGWEGGNDLNQFSIGYPTFWRDYERLGRTVATEHTMYSTTERLWSVAEERDYTNEDPEGIDWQEDFTTYKFAEAGAEGDQAEEVSFSFWDGYKEYAVKWQYNPDAKTFARFNGGEPHKDRNTGEQLQTKNVVILYMAESKANDGYPNNVHLLYDNIGSGDALVFQEGNVIEGTWEKDSRLDRTKLYNESGEEIEFVRGQIWFEILPLGTNVSY